VLVAGVDSSTQSCKVVVRDASDGRLARTGRAAHPAGTEVDPEHWWRALREAAADAGGLDDVAAVAVGAQQHGLVALDADGAPVRDALLWNDTRSAVAAGDLIGELGDGDEQRGRRRWAEATGLVPVASFTVSKLRWFAEHEPALATRTAAVALPHDWLTARLRSDGAGTAVDVGGLSTDAGDASGTGYFDPVAGEVSRRPAAARSRAGAGTAEGGRAARVRGHVRAAGARRRARCRHGRQCRSGAGARHRRR